MKNEESKPCDEGRRTFLVRLSLGMGGIIAAAISVPVIAALLAPFFESTKQTWRNVGKTDEFQIGTTNLVKFINSNPKPWAGITANSAAWLRRMNESEFIAFSVNCTHLGCPVRWEPGAELFMCPCHGGVYYKDGSRASGPPPKGLQKYQTRVLNGQVQILASPIPISGLKIENNQKS